MNADIPFFSIVMPAYNRAGLIGKSIQSILDQAYSDFEILVINDGGTDNTADVVKRFTDQRVRYYEKPHGERAAARNFGIRHALGKYVTFLDSDDILYDDHLSHAKKFIEENNSPEIFHNGYEIRNEKNALLSRVGSITNLRAVILKGNPLSCIGVFVRHDIIAGNLFNEDYQMSGLEDWELWLRIAATHEILSSGKVTAAMIQHSGRSVVEEHPEKLEKKTERFLHHVFANTDNKRIFGSKLKKVSAGVKTYTALHLLMMRNNKRKALRYLRQGIIEDPAEIFRKRFPVILKLLLLS